MTTTIGELLRLKRIERGLSLEKISEDIFIKIHYLQALENDQHELLPSDVQGKGFLRLYANYLDLPVEPLIDSWQSMVIPDLQSQPTHLEKNIDLETQPDHSNTYVDELIFHHEIEDRSPNNSGIGTNLPESQRIFLEIGRELKNQREKLSISLVDVEKYIRLKPVQIDALENGRIDKLTSSVQAKGMLKIYASFLQIDPEKVLLHFADGLQAQLLEKKLSDNPSKMQQTGDPEKKISAWRRLITLDLVVGSSIILSLLIFSIWGLTQITSSGNQGMDILAPDIVEILQITPSSNPDKIENGTPTVATTQPTELFMTESETSNLNVAKIDDLTSTIPASDNALIQLYIVALQRAYLKVSADGEVEFEGRIISGNVYQFSGNKLIEMITGNAAALDVYFNQNDIGTLGDVGQVVRLQFTTAGIITPTPIFTLTATPTPINTITLQPTPTEMSPTPSPTPILP
jgi:cytoskeleton protein RodZ